MVSLLGSSLCASRCALCFALRAATISTAAAAAAAHRFKVSRTHGTSAEIATADAAVQQQPRPAFVPVAVPVGAGAGDGRPAQQRDVYAAEVLHAPLLDLVARVGRRRQRGAQQVLLTVSKCTISTVTQ